MKIRTEFWQPPIPNRSFDWKAIDDDTYCCGECHSPVGHGATEQEAIADLMEQIDPLPTMDDGYYDEAPWSDSDTERERQNSIKGR